MTEMTEPMPLLAGMTVLDLSLLLPGPMAGWRIWPNSVRA